MALARDKSSWPRVLRGFEHIGRLWDPQHQQVAAKILPGEYYVTSNEEIITTVLGSCISACIRDPDTGIGGMNHFMLPGDCGRKLDRWGGSECFETRFGIAAMEALINDIMKLGARKHRLEVKLFGGGRVLAMDKNNVGDRNIEFARKFLAAEGYRVASEDVGGPHPRKVNYFPRTGKVMVKRLRALENRIVARQESNYENSASAGKPGEIELFD